MSVDRERIIRVMERITDENLKMSNWARSPIPEMTCGTAMCFAGHTVVDAGYRLAWCRDDYSTGLDAYYADETTDGQDIETLARELLGLDPVSATRLFYSVNVSTVDELWEVVTRITGVERPVPSEVW